MLLKCARARAFIFLCKGAQPRLCFLFHAQQERPSSSSAAVAAEGSSHSVYNTVAHSFIRKVHSLYQRALRKFRGNVGLWLEFTTFCYSHGNQRLLSEVISQALRLNPSCAGLWAFAASWEYKRKVRQKNLFVVVSIPFSEPEHLDIRVLQGDISAARYLLLRGLRNCNQSKGWFALSKRVHAVFPTSLIRRHAFLPAVLWHGYFRLEMLYAADLNTRRQILGAGEDADNGKMVCVVVFTFNGKSPKLTRRA